MNVGKHAGPAPAMIVTAMGTKAIGGKTHRWSGKERIIFGQACDLHGVALCP